LVKGLKVNFLKTRGDKIMHYHFKIHKETDAIWAECIELNGCSSQGDNIEHLKKMMKEALNLYLDEPVDSTIDLSLPDDRIKGKNIVRVPVEPSIAFSLTVKYYRKKKHLSQKQMTELLKMKNIFSYQRLEKRTDPKLSTIMKIKKIFPEISVDYILDV
jgi:predicted RNase H-like HicB family nuclease